MLTYKISPFAFDSETFLCEEVDAKELIKWVRYRRENHAVGSVEKKGKFFERFCVLDSFRSKLKMHGH